MGSLQQTKILLIGIKSSDKERKDPGAQVLNRPAMRGFAEAA
jgi:hypothetical protein